MRADKFFAEKYGSRTKAQAVLAQGLILKDGKPLAPDSELNGGEEFTFLRASYPTAAISCRAGWTFSARPLQAKYSSISAQARADLRTVCCSGAPAACIAWT